MIRNEPWPEGTPAWVDLNVPDHLAAHAFYAGLFGWEFLPPAGPEMGFYSMSHRGGKMIAGVAQSEEPAAWTTYLATDDIEATLAKAAEAGGQVLVGPETIEPFGRFAAVLDPVGAVFGLWQAKEHIGSNVVNEPGAVIWNESYGLDLEAAKAFYGHVFDYEFGEMSQPGFEFVTIAPPGGEPVGGLGGPGSKPEGTEPAWFVYFATEDTEKAVERVVELGGSVLSDPRPSPFGTMATVAGPSGEVFVLMSTAEPVSQVTD
ncbi:VOC family protein [Actinotalea sp.]|uniref:VOC family protein n=1 Tax=Actinotalea sp. TaxID=1872145 RepID=UPI0035659E0B